MSPGLMTSKKVPLVSQYLELDNGCYGGHVTRARDLTCDCDLIHYKKLPNILTPLASLSAAVLEIVKMDGLVYKYCGKLVVWGIVSGRGPLDCRGGRCGTGGG